MIIIAAQLEGYRSLRDKSIKITFESQELNPQELLGIAENLNAFGYLAFKKEPFKEDERKTLEAIKTDFDDKAKSPSQRLRSVLFVAWNQDNKGFEDFDSYYRHKMNQIIEHLKSKLD